MKSDRKITATRWLRAIPLMILVLLTGCMPKLPLKGSLRGPETYRVPTGIVTGGFKRDYLLHIPTNYNGHQALPMVVVVHGAFDTGKGIEEITGFSEIADRENFLVLYPNGIGILGFLQHWNAGHCCGKAQGDNIDDVGFVATVIESAARRVKVDRHRIFMLGFSNGGMFTYRFAAEKSHLLAGAAALAASIGSRTPNEKQAWQIPEPANPIPFLIMHGTADTSVPLEGQASQRRGTPRYYQSVAKSTTFWSTRNGCNEAEPTQHLFNSAVQLTKWTDCISNMPIWLYTLQDWDHTWPGPYFLDQTEQDHPLNDFDAAEITWNFFKEVTKSSGHKTGAKPKKQGYTETPH